MQRFLISLILISCFTACRRNQPDIVPALGEQRSEQIQVDSRTRDYIIYLPKAWNLGEKLPLILALHGGGGDGEGMLKLADFRAIADSEKVIIVYPSGIEQNWNDGRPTNPNKLGINDVNFFRTLINNLTTKYPVDAKRVYATGISNGGFMSSRLAAELSDKIAAIAVVAASMEKTTVAPACNPPVQVPVIYIHGDADPIVPFLGGTMTKGDGGQILSHQEVVNKWVTLNKCNTTPVSSDIPDIANDGTTIKKKEYTTNGVVTVVDYVVQGGGHTWPGGYQYLVEFIIGKTSKDMNTNEVVWKFFKNFERG